MSFERVEIAAVVFAGESREPAFVFEVPGELVDPE